MAVRVLHHVQTGCIASCLLLAPFILEGMGVGTPALVIPHVPLMNILHTIMIDVFLAGLLYRAAFIIVIASTRLPAAKAVSGHQRLVQYQQDACSSYMVAYPDGFTMPRPLSVLASRVCHLKLSFGSIPGCSVQVITITSRYVLFNNSSEPLQYGQRNTNLVWQLAPGVKAPFHWDDADGRFELCVRPAQGKWNWSGAFEVSHVAKKVFHSVLPVFVVWHLGVDYRQ